ncbi:hypothetical protein WJ12_18455 [Burkholderia seminalis]|nr:hypothetical protein WJ12_18455 [Burkholderia seminalis]KVF48185.1 hypothetical protein WJ13_00360 [Burkholderia seminalis]
MLERLRELQVLRANPVAVRYERRQVHDVFQLADITGPRVRLQRMDRALGRYRLRPLAQRRQAHADEIDAIARAPKGGDARFPATQ